MTDRPDDRLRRFDGDFDDAILRATRRPRPERGPHGVWIGTRLIAAGLIAGLALAAWWLA